MMIEVHGGEFGSFESGKTRCGKAGIRTARKDGTSPHAGEFRLAFTGPGMMKPAPPVIRLDFPAL
jgi:hypothetical protein